MNHQSASEQETAQIAAQIANTLKSGDILCLYGDLGAGKSVFCRSLIRTLSSNNTLEVPSPTFTLVQTYDTYNAPVWHFDLYRLEDPEEIYEIGWEDALYDGICLIEWPQKLGALLPPKRTDITITTNSDETRNINIESIPS